MAGRIRAEDIEAVRERADIVKVVGEYLSLKKAGHDSYVGLCPFHQEKSPSFSVSPAKGVYYCFGCQAGGDVVRFLQETEQLSFREAIESLARGIGYTLRYEGDDPAARKAASRRQALYTANEEAAALFHQMLLEGDQGQEARTYLAERGIEKATVERFQVGVAPPDTDFLLRQLSSRIAPDLLVEAGLAAKDSTGTIRDRFRGRITFPIADLSGRHIGFGARILPSSDQPAKYINTAETPVYHKGSVLYNLHRAKAAAGRTGEVFVAEGYTDVIGLAQAGIEAAVATCGTALTEDHLRLLARFARRAFLTFDGDEAGARAAERAYGFHQTAQIDLVVLVIPGGQDPADFVREHGGDAFRDLAEGARPLVEYMLRRLLQRADHASIEGRSRAVDEALPLIQGLTDPVRRTQYAHLLADLAGVDASAVVSKLQRATRTAARPPGRKDANGGGNSGVGDAVSSPGVPSAIATRGSAQERVEREMLKVLLQDPDAAGIYGAMLDHEHFATGAHRAAFDAIVASGGEVRTAVRAEASDQDGATDPGARLLLRLAVEPLEGAVGTAYAQSVWSRIEELRLQRLRDEARQQLQRLNPVTDPSYDQLFQELIELDGALRKVREARVG